MSRKQHPLHKRIFFNTLGTLCVIGSILFGWLPGPGGIPLLLTGLGLLALNNEWAERLLDRVKQNIYNLNDIIFVNKPAIQLAWDSAAIVLFALAVYLIGFTRSYITQGAGVSVLAITSYIFLSNRSRYKRFKQ